MSVDLKACMSKMLVIAGPTRSNSISYDLTDSEVDSLSQTTRTTSRLLRNPFQKSAVRTDGTLNSLQLSHSSVRETGTSCNRRRCSRRKLPRSRGEFRVPVSLVYVDKVCSLRSRLYSLQKHWTLGLRPCRFGEQAYKQANMAPPASFESQVQRLCTVCLRHA